MAFEKKPSSNTDRGKVRSAEELETYGVWVKSGPQDMSADFGDDAVPFDAGFDMGFGGMGTPGAGREPPDIAFDSFDDGSFVADDFADGDFAPGPFENDNFAQVFPPDGAGSSPKDEVSAQLLLRIADELSSIRADLDTLKQEFADIRSEGEPAEENETLGTGFFTGEDDGKITLTDNEMDNILASSGFQDGGHGFAFDENSDFASLRDADEAALKELSRQNDAVGAGSLVDEDEMEGEAVDFGMDLDDPSPFGDVGEGDEADMQERFSELETDNIFDTDLDFLDEGTSRTSRLDIEESDIFEAFADDLPSPDALEDLDELRDLRMHGVNPLTPPPEDSSYLEEDPFVASVTSDAEDIFDTGIDEDGFDIFSSEVLQGALDEEAQSDDGVVLLGEVSEISYTEELPSADGISLLDDDGSSFDDMSSMDMDDEEFSIGNEVFLGDPLSQDDELSLDDSSSIDGELSIDDDLPLNDELPVGDLSPIDGLFLDDGELSLDDEMSLDDDELSLDEEIPLGDDALALDGDLSMDEEIPLDSELPSDGEIALPSWLLSPETEKEDDGELATGGEISLEDEPSLEEETSGDEALLEPSEPLSDELMLDEPSLDEPIQDDDILLDLDGFDDGFDIDDQYTDDSNIIRVIPEGFKTGAEDPLVSFDDDLEAITEDEEEGDPPPPPPPKEKPNGKPKTRAEKMTALDDNPDISPNLRKDLKNVLSYMDQLLESLPEDKIEEFAKSEHFDTYRKLFKELGLVQ